ncbi:MAG: VanZ family protein [Eubacterium sp.]|nr:VanZ family protein [Eubacterium sp.]
MIINITTGLFIILFFAISVCVYIYRTFRPEQLCSRYYVVVSFVFYTLVLAKVVLFPIYIFDKAQIPMMYEGAENYIRFYQFVPFASIRNYFSSGTIIQLAGNIVLLFPLIIFWDIFTKGKKKISFLTIVGVCTSVLIELYQLLTNYLTGFPGHVADIDDLILNSLGVFLAAGVIAIARKKNVDRTFIARLLWVKKD